MCAPTSELPYCVFLLLLPALTTLIPAWLFYESAVANMGSPSDDRSTRLRVWFLIAMPALTVCAALVTWLSHDLSWVYAAGGMLWAFGCFGAFLFSGEPLGPSLRVLADWQRRGTRRAGSEPGTRDPARLRAALAAHRLEPGSQRRARRAQGKNQRRSRCAAGISRLRTGLLRLRRGLHGVGARARPERRHAAPAARRRAVFCVRRSLDCHGGRGAHHQPTRSRHAHGQPLADLRRHHGPGGLHVVSGRGADPGHGLCLRRRLGADRRRPVRGGRGARFARAFRPNAARARALQHAFDEEEAALQASAPEPANEA